MKNWGRSGESVAVNQRGASMLELITASLISTTLIAAAFATFHTTNGAIADNEVIHGAEDSAHHILELLSKELRLAGAGVPLGHKHFAAGTPGLADAPLPILLNSDEEEITLRLNPRGREAVLTADFDPAQALSIQLTDSRDLTPGDVVYVSGAISGSEYAMKAKVVATPTATTLEISEDYIAVPGATFSAGSLLARVKEVSYFSNRAQREVIRAEGNLTSLLGTEAEFNLDYLDSTGMPVSLPLTDTAVADKLAAIEITVTVDGKRPLQNGKQYQAIALQRISLRNLSLGRLN